MSNTNSLNRISTSKDIASLRAGLQKLRMDDSPTHIGKPDIANLQGALQKLKLDIAPEEIANRQLGDTTTAAIRKLQTDAGLQPTGTLTPDTVKHLNVALQHVYYTDNKGRMEKVQSMLGQLGYTIDADELKRHAFGPSTTAALKAFQEKAQLTSDGIVTDDVVSKLEGDSLTARLSTKTQIGQTQRTLLRALGIAKLDASIDPSELKAKQLGPTTKAAISAFQQKYKLPVTGDLDPATVARIQSVVVSRPAPARTLKVAAATQLSPVSRVLRLNMKNKHVGDLQQALAFLGYPIDETEFKANTFGKTTREAVIAYQRRYGLPVTGHVAGDTLQALNRDVARANPPAVETGYAYRVRGSVRDDLWRGKSGVKVQVWEKTLRDSGALLGERKTLTNGFFNLPYEPPRDLVTKQIKSPFHLQVKVVDNAGTVLQSKVLFNPGLTGWANFTEGDQPYRGTSEYDARMTAVTKVLGNIAITEIEETDTQQDITHVALNSGLSQDDVMRLVLAARAAQKLNDTTITAPVFYAFIRQNLPANLPSDLLHSTVGWTLIDQVVEQAVNGLVFMDADLQAEAFDNAVKENLIPIETGSQKSAVLSTLATLKQTFALEKPILIGNGSLRELLGVSSVPVAQYTAVADAFLTHKGLGSDFWADLHGRANDFGGAAAVQDLETTVYVGEIAKNHMDTVSFLKSKIADPSDTHIKSARDLAKLTHDDWVGLINENGGKVPDNTDGTSAEKVAVYATTLASQSERLFPTVAFTAEVKRSSDEGHTNLAKIGDISDLIDAHPDLDLRATNLDAFMQDNNLTLDAETLGEARVMQRVHRITPTSATGRALLEAQIHHSAQIVQMGKDRFVSTLADKSIDSRTALTVYNYAEFQYANALAKLTDYRFELHRADPQAIVKYTYTPEEQQELVGNIPDLETLFGSLDFCDCDHCQSVYGPAAYLADVLRFLDSHPSTQTGKTVRDILFTRRPDIGNIKLNCDNTETPLPYIDLVCEVLESAVPAPSTESDFKFQTTRTANELRAFAENVRKDAYDLLKTADYPINSTFNLWQEEARIYLQHLGVNRADLMEAFQARPAGGTPAPSDSSIAGEFWGMSSHETDIITTAATSATDQTKLWGFDATQSTMAVSTFLDHAKIEYNDLLSLLYVQWLNPSTDANRTVIERPADTCDTEKQNLTKLTAARLDQMYRLLRLWRHTGWQLWQLDLMLRASALANNQLDGDALVRMQEFKQVQDQLNLDFETALGFYHRINTEVRSQPDDAQKQIQPLYVTLFQNPAVINPVDDAFKLPLSGSEKLSDHKPTLLAAMALTEPDLALLMANLPNGNLTLANLTSLYNYAMLAQGLGLRIVDLLTLLDLADISNPFASPRQTLDLTELHRWVNDSGLLIGELDYLLNYRPDSPYGLRADVIAQDIEALRESLRSNTATDKQGQIASQVATTFGLTNEQAQILLTTLDLGGPLMGHLSDSTLTAKDANDQYTTEISETNFPKIYNAYRLLHKAAMLVTRYKITRSENLMWLLANHTTLKTLSFSELPVTGAPASPLFPTWLALHKVLTFKSRYPEPEGSSLTGVFDLATDLSKPVDDVLAALSTLTTWKLSDLQTLHSGLKLERGTQTAPSDYLNADTYLRFAKCLDIVRRTGVDAATVLTWANRDDDTADTQFVVAQQVKQAAKSRHDYAAWLSIATPFEDALREKKRTALVEYLAEHSLRNEPATISVNGKTFPNRRYWRDANDLLGYFLIDVEMSACQLTSRIKQAMSSTQMFVQRCFLNLEQPEVEVSKDEQADTTSLNSWKQWKWMKSYRIWEANRKIFLYPENWLEPALRDDKSPFFVELENELSQNDITADSAESAFLHYVEKAHEVSRLDIVGVYHEVDDYNPYDNLPPNINVLHVIGRTRAQPAIYYYRKFDVNYNTWTAWEKIDLDITGDHVVPVVYNRKLHLFWLSFMEKPQKVRKQPPAQASTQPTSAPEPPKQLEIQLAWSVRKDSGWTNKQVSHEKLIHPWQRPLYSYHLKPRYKSRENLLWLDIYISTSLPFNNTQFYDPYQNTPAFVTAFRYNETARPWHASSFVFDGHVVDVKMKALAGMYHVLDSKGVASDTLASVTSYQYVHDSFGEDGREINVLSGPYEIAPRLLMPDGMHYDNTYLANNKTNPNTNKLNVLESGASKTLLTGAKSPFELVFSQHSIQFDTASWGTEPLVYQDAYRSFFIKPEWQDVIVGSSQTLQQLKYTFFPMYHPYTALFLRELGRSGLDGLLNRSIQVSPQAYYPGNNFSFSASYGPTSSSIADPTAQSDIIDFSPYGAYSLYNWEIFFHAPFMIACKLSQNQRFEEAMNWFHYIFDPTNVEAVSVPQRFWVTRPFYEMNSDAYRKQRIQDLLSNIGANLEQLNAWKNNPFKPYVIARYRPLAYQKAVVMRYIDNLISWGDQLFRQDTIEAINEATTLYVLAYELLGRKPVKVPNVEHTDYSYNELVADGQLDPFGNKKVEVLMENFAGAPVRIVRGTDGTEPLPTLDVSYFAIPNNEKLLEYWTTVEDRLFKIRNCMNIEGVVRQLPLFEPPIDPALLVKAAAAGVDLSSVLSDVAAPQGQYRFRTLAQRATELAAEVRALGDKILSVLEKRDAEGLALLRSVNEINLLEAVKEVRENQITEATDAQAALEQAKALADERKSYYEGRDFMNPWEITAMSLGGLSALAETAIAVGNALAGGLALIPKFTVGASGFGGSPHVTGDPVDGLHFSRAAEAAVQTLSSIARASDKLGSLASTMGSYQRRQDEWSFQGRLATIEGQQIDKQIAAAQIRLAIAQQELDNQNLQIDQSQAVDEYLRSKYTNQQLFDWMLTQVSTVYFQSYQLAYDMAKRAEKSFQLELARPDATFIQFGYWDSLKKGLLAGERLANDIHRMDASYYDQNKRLLEITKHISLAQVTPLSLVQLKETGMCLVSLPEWLFDMDFPGHYRRRIRSVAITIPCVVGPYTSINCTLSLTNHGVRLKDDVAAGYGDPLAAPDDRFWKSPVPIQSIATSHAQNDAGLFELNFNDERYLPFEGAGAVSEWNISLPKENNMFDFATISDVILHIKYGAEAGSTALAQAARDNVNAVLPKSGARLLVLDREFGTEWYRFLHPVIGNDQTLEFTLKPEHLPFWARNKTVKLSRVDLLADSSETGNFDVKLQLPGATAPSDEVMSADATMDGVQHMQKGSIVPSRDALGTWKIQVKKASDSNFQSLKPEDLRNVYLIIGFNVT